MKIIKLVFGIYQLVLALLGLFFAVIGIVFSVIISMRQDNIMWYAWLVQCLIFIFIIIGAIYCFINGSRWITGKKELFAKIKGVLIFSILSSIFLTVIICIMSKQLMGIMQSNRQQQSLYGQISPEFTASSIEGDIYKLSDMRGKYVLLEFWATWCGPCVKDLPNVQKIRDKYSSNELVILGISQDYNINTLRKFIEENHYTFTIIHDKGNEIESLFNVSGIPMNFLINPEGKIVSTNRKGEAMLKEISRRLK